MLKKIVLVLAVGLGLLVAYAAAKPADYVIAREVTIQAAPASVFPYVNNSRLTGQWMPWAESDPQMKMVYSGAQEGVGSVASWDSPGRMGTGSSTIITSAPNEKVEYQLEYKKPFPMKQTARIEIKPSGDRSVIRWSVAGHSPLMARVMCLFMNMDKIVGTSFDKGLSNLKTLVESRR